MVVHCDSIQLICVFGIIVDLSICSTYHEQPWFLTVTFFSFYQIPDSILTNSLWYKISTMVPNMQLVAK